MSESESNAEVPPDLEAQVEQAFAGVKVVQEFEITQQNDLIYTGSDAVVADVEDVVNESDRG